MLLRMVLSDTNTGAAGPRQAGDTGLVTLDRLNLGEHATVREINGDQEELIRLRVMGLCIGQCVHPLRTGRRMIVCVGGRRIGLADDVARAVLVQPLPHPPTAAAVTPR